jgi:hypothetical protein
MLYKSQLISAGSGKINGMVASHNAGGAYMRALKIPSNPNSPAQQTVRTAMATLAANWKALSAAGREAWATYAANVPVQNALGDTIHVTGQNMYVRSNIPRLQSGLAVVTTAPTTFDLGDFSGCTLTAAAAGTTGTVTFSASDTWATTNANTTALLLYTASPKAGSVNYFKGPYRYAGKVNSTSGSATFTLPVAAGGSGSRTFFRAIVSRSDGRLSSTFRGFAAIA